MRLQTQNNMYVVPIFLVLAVAISAIVGVQERDKTLWGLREEASSLAIGIAEFLGAEGLQTLRDGCPGEASTEELLRPIHRILQWERAKRISARVRGSRTPLFDLGPWARGFADTSAVAAGASSPPAEVRVLKQPSGGSIVVATAPVTDPDGRVLGQVSVETDASAVDRLEGGWIRDSVVRLLVALAVGLACSGILSWVLRSRIHHLGLALEAAAQGDYTAELDARSGIIRETSDLANTFSTMVSIFRGTVSRTRRNLLGVERFRTDEDIAEAMDANCWKPKQMSEDGVTILVRGVGRLPKGTLFDLFRADGRVHAVFGRVLAKGSLDAALSASAALSLLRQLLEREKMERVVSEMADPFHLQELTVLTWVGSDQRLAVHRFDSGARRMESGVAVETRPFREVFHSLGEEADTRIRLYLKAFPSDPPAKLAEELMTLISVMQPVPRGVLTVMFAE